MAYVPRFVSAEDNFGLRVARSTSHEHTAAVCSLNSHNVAPFCEVLEAGVTLENQIR